jgi:hypothetical protein
MPYEEFCDETYNRIYTNEYVRILNGRTSQNAMVTAERTAQRLAIKDTLKLSLDAYSPVQEAADLWRAIYVSHLKRKAGVHDLNRIDEHVIQSVISADQSWKKASGHAFESFIFEVANPLLERQSIKFMLQTELTRMIHDNQIHNDAVDIEWLNQRIHTDVFDLYAVLSRLDRNFVFGCIQSKTSIRDRVTRDREPSRQAMEASFWSIAITLDGAFLALPKFQEMVNGGGIDYELNGWHGLYVMSDRYANDRIYSVNRELNLVIQHAQSAAEAWMSARNRFNNLWRPR